MRMDITELRQQYPQIANEYIALRDQLESQADKAHQVDQLSAPESTKYSNQRYNSSQELEQKLQTIWKIPGFDRFLLGPSEDECKAAAIDGPIVVVNISIYSYNALIVEEASIRALQLPGLRYEDVCTRAEALTNPESLELEVLEWLWETVAKPVLDALGFVKTPSGSWPRIWWIPTGLLAKFPIHAAGRHCDGSSDTVLDRVISSYSSSIKRLILSRQNRPKISPPLVSESMVLLGMEETPGHSSLQFVSQEIEALEKLCESSQLRVSRPRPFQRDVLAAIRNCKIFHFAGHGLSNPLDPLTSSLLLTDEPLTVASLIETNLHSRKPFLAYLSACGTGQVKHDKVIGEGFHLISACKLAGFQHVIGTLWEVNDESCVDVAVTTYEWIQKHDLSDAAVSEGLHRACRKLRGQWVSENAVRAANRKGRRGRVPVEQPRSSQSTTREERDVDPGDDGPLYWVPYVHFGI